jgi:hypothetical protein
VDVKRWMVWLVVPLVACGTDIKGDECDDDEDCEEQGEGLVCLLPTDATEDEKGTCEVDDRAAAD